MTASLIDSGNAALKAGRWRDAADAFRAALDSEQAAEALLGLGQAMWWLGDMTQGLAFLERGYAAFRRRPDPLHAAICALRLAYTSAATSAIPPRLTDGKIGDLTDARPSGGVYHAARSDTPGGHHERAQGPPSHAGW